jgi:serine/threonine protein kinase
MIQFSCPCGQKFRIKPEFAGRKTTCPACKQPLVVPTFDSTQAIVPKDQINGTASSIAQVGMDGGVTLEPPSGGKTSQKLVQDLLARRGKSKERYFIEGEIARGGMGAVLRAVDCDIRREVAVKYLLDQSDPKKKQRFIEEAQITGQLEHPNIPPVHELGADKEKRLFFSMKMVQGRSLAQVLNELRQNPKTAEREWSLARLLNIFVNVCNGLAYGHSRGVVHRDLKPANVMVGGFGEVYVMDWGLAKVLKGGQASELSQPAASVLPSQSVSVKQSSKVETSREGEADLTQEGSVLGTPVYMPPEQASGNLQAIDHRSDIYSLGAILYEMLTLQSPVDKEGGYLSILLRVMGGEIVPPEQRTPKRVIPKELSAIAMKALAKNPTNRYPNVENLRKDIERFQEGRSVSAKEDTFKEMAWKLVKRNKLVSALTTVLAVVLVWGFGANWLARQEAVAAHTKTRETTEKAVPALIEAARLGVERRNYPNASKQVDLALTYLPDDADALLLKGQLLIVNKRFVEAQATLNEYLRQRSSDMAAKSLIELCQKPHPDEEATSLAFARVFNQQETYGLIDGVLAPWGKTSAAARDFLLQKYRKQIEATWPGQGDRLQIDTAGLRLNFDGFADVSDLSPLRNMPLTSLNVKNCQQVQDLSPLRGMLLTSLNVHFCKQVKDLTPLKGMPLQELNLFGLPLTDLRLLKDMPLTSLDISHCSDLHDLSALEGMRLETIALSTRNITRGMDVLRRMKTLRTIANAPGGKGPEPYPAAEFWKKHDAGELK